MMTQNHFLWKLEGALGLSPVYKEASRRSTRCFHASFMLEVLLAVTAANTSLCCNSKERISKLRQSRAQQIQFILSQLAGKCIGNSSDGSR